MNAWTVEYEVLKVYAEMQMDSSPKGYQSFLTHSEAVVAVIDKKLDKDGFFKDSGASEAVKSAIDRAIKDQDPSLANRLKKAVNKHPDIYPRKTDILNDVAELAQALEQSQEKSWFKSLLESTANVLEQLPTILAETAECVAKTTVAGPYADYYELRHQKSFCDDSEMETWEVVVSGVSLSATAASAAASGPGAILADKAGKFFKGFLSVGKKVWKSAKAIKYSEHTLKVLESAKRLEIKSKDLLKRFAFWFHGKNKKELDDTIDELIGASAQITEEMIKKSPWLGDTRAGVRAMLMYFKGGASYLIPESGYIRRIKDLEPTKLVGRPDGQFIMTRDSMDKLLKEANGSLEYVKKRLGIPPEYWNEKLVRIDLDDPFEYNLRLPSGFEEGANELFVWGGITKGGIPEAVVDQFPKSSIRVSETALK